MDGDPPAVPVDDQLHHVKAEAETGNRLVGGGALERFEDLLPHRWFDAGTVVNHLDTGRIHAAPAIDPDLDRFAGPVLDGV